MEILYLLVILFLFVWLRNSHSTEIRALAREINKLREIIQKDMTGRQRPEEKIQDVKPQPQQEIIAPPVITEEKISPPEEIRIPIKEEVYSFEPIKENVVEKPVEPLRPRPAYNPPPKQPSFFERHPDLEKFIGENLINKIGIAILVLGISFFVKYAIDKDWINEIGRVCIGVLCGGLLIAIAHRLRKSFKAFSSVLIGGGLSVLYFTIAIAFHTYHIFDQSAAFGIMVVITGFAVALSILYNRIELAVLALIGGFSTPFIVSTGQGNYVVLFTYLLILNCGMLVLAYRKKWNLVNILCYAFTVFIYAGWLINNCLGNDNAPYPGALSFATAFYIIFFLMNVIYNIRNKTEFETIDISILLSNTFLYYAAGMSILHFYAKDFQGIFTTLLGVFNFGFAYAFYRKRNIDKKLIFLLIGLVLTFISLAAPVQLEGNYITLFWSVEAVLLLWFSQKTGIKLVKYTSVIIMILMLISLVMDWGTGYIFPKQPFLPVLLNKLFITSIVSILSMLAIRKLLNNEKDEHHFLFYDFELSWFKNIITTVTVILLFLTMLYELNHQLIHYGVENNARYICIGIYIMTFLTTAYFLTVKRNSKTLSTVFFIGSVMCILMYMTVYDNAIVIVRRSYLMNNTDGTYFFLHFLLSLLFAFAIYISNQSGKQIAGTGNNHNWIKWGTVILIVYICSAELNHIVTWISYSPGRMISLITKQVSKAGFSVLWGLISLVLMQQGMKRKDRMLRIISLSLFFVTILKLFLWDIVGISESGKIIAFISLGVLLLVVSFMYQRLKKLILENEKTELKNENSNENELDKI